MYQICFGKKKNIFKCSLIKLRKNLSNYKYSIDYKDELYMIKKIVRVLAQYNLKGNSYEIVDIIKNDNELKKISIKGKIKFKKNRKDLY